MNSLRSRTSAVTSSYRGALCAGVGAALAAAAVAGVVDTVRAAGAHGLGGGQLPQLWAIAFALYAGPALLAGVIGGVIAAAFSASFGPGALGAAYRRLRADPELDRDASAALLAGACAALILAAITAIGARALVAHVSRKGVGAALLGVVVVSAVPLCALAALPIYRLLRPLARLVPARPLPRAVLVAIAGVTAVVGIALWVVATRLDWRAIAWGRYAMAALCVAVAAAWLVLWYRPLAGLRRRIPNRGVLTAVAAAIALACPIVLMSTTPRPAVVTALTRRAWGTPTLIATGRALIDEDGDGYSPFLGGPDCDDHNPNVHPGAREIPDNGIDDDCIGGDLHAAALRAKVHRAKRTPAAARKTRPARNVLMIAIDTLRADRLGAAGYRRDGKSLTPDLDAFAAGATRFTHVYSQAPNTPRSFPSIFTSRFPSEVAVDKSFKNYSRILPKNVTLWEVLQQAGLHTVGISSHFYFKRSRGIQQGFDEYDNRGALTLAGSNTDIASPRIVPRVLTKLAQLSRGGRRFAMFVHLFEPHARYMVHPGFPITLHGIPGLVQKYDYEIAFVDRYVGKILHAVDADGLAKNTMIVILADHGEAFGVHRVAGKRMFFHGQTLYDELLRVPLLIRLPGAKPAVINDVEMLIDVAPTICDALGIPPSPTFRGRSLLKRLWGEPLPPRPAYAELLPEPSWNRAAKMMVSADGRYKLIYDITGHRFELYDLRADPKERRNLAHSQRARLKSMRAQLARWMEVVLPVRHRHRHAVGMK